MDPYRTMAVDEVPEAPRNAGIVGDVIAQFADPNAFYRELVQNSIDADSPSIEIRLEHDAAEQKMHVTVRDRGCGMSRDVIEDQLLVLFRSTKETDHSKIGKFGIGFASVLAPNPEVVIVQSARDGRRLTLHLYRDLTYELFDAGTATQTGTTVELVIAMPGDGVEAFVHASVDSLIRWCRHATIPIELSYIQPDGAPQTIRIDRPLAIENAIVEVSGTSSNGKTQAVVGITPDAAPYMGFFNHGLTLYETREPLAGNVAAKVLDSRLGHTLSRDNVRRDAAFDRAVSYARELALTQLPIAARNQLREAANTADHRRYRTLAAALAESRLAFDWSLPLVIPIDGARAISAVDHGTRVWASDGASPIATILATTNVPVVDLHGSIFDQVAAAVLQRHGCKLVRVASELTSVIPIEVSDADTALLALIKDMFVAAGTSPSAILFARLEGAYGDAIAIAGDAARQPGAYVIDAAGACRSPFARLRKPPLVISADHPTVAAARACDLRLAASHLVRAILLDYRRLDVASSQRLLAQTLGLLGVS